MTAHSELVARLDDADRAYRLLRPVRLGKGGWERELTGDGGRVCFMARAKGYVMVRRPHCTPFVLSDKEWKGMPLFAQPSDDGEKT